MGDRLWQAYTLTSLGDALNKQGQHDRALHTCRQAHDIARALHHPSSEAWAQLGIGAAQQGRHDLAAARQTLQDCLARFRHLTDPRLDASAWYFLGLTARDEGQSTAARAALHEAQAIFERLGITASVEKTKVALESIPDPVRYPAEGRTHDRSS